jgi:hypothetical protein
MFMQNFSSLASTQTDFHKENLEFFKSEKSCLKICNKKKKLQVEPKLFIYYMWKVEMFFEENL